MHNQPKQFSGKLKTLFLACGTLLMGTQVQAQVPVFPTTTDLSYASFTQQIYTLNADMLELPGGNQIKAVAWDPYPPNSGVDIKVTNNIGGSASLHIPSFVECVPDVVIAHDPTNGRYVLSVVYLNSSQFVTFDTYFILGANTGSITLQPFKSVVLTSKRGYFPHIDMLPDFTAPISGLPTMHKFVITYGQLDDPTVSPFVINIYEVHGDISNPGALSPVTPITSGGHCGSGADVAVSFDPVTNLQHIYLVYGDAFLGLFQAELRMNAAASPIAPPIGGTVINPVPNPPGTTGALLPRIEAMAYNPTGSGMVPWVIGGIFFDGTTHQIYEINPAIGGGFNCTAAMVPGSDNYAVAVCAGAGRPGGAVCNRNYNIGWYNTQLGYVTQAIDAFSGMISTSAPNYYIANSTAIGMAVTKVPIAISSCSNSGNFMFTAWWDGGTGVWYKLKPTVTGYKPGATGIGEATGESALKLYPNPTAGGLTLEGADKAAYRIVNISGSLVAEGRVSGSTASLDVAALVPGIYYITLADGGRIQRLEFVKK
ncbi:T9SS type A sorting domain-containing protein [Taibaiella koreensis]|uniref:T9SS type A sorting domain-containing protein n=1 Tax=Taibaiella koreensis TaxID=1268548 RepID=UPI000E59B212|nr:T9SS type A sorting domain-containing protein [Taibaiella koreensis]